MNPLKNRPLTIAYLIMGLGFSIAFWAERYDSAWDEYRRCQTALESRTALRAVISQAYSSGTQLNFTRIESFNDLPDTVKTFLLDLQEAGTSGNPSSRKERIEHLLELVPIEECREPGLL